MAYPEADVSAGSQNRLLLFVLLFTVMLSKYHIYVGFSIKPYMICLGILVLLWASTFRFQRLQLFEILLLSFYIIYAFSGVFALYAESSMRVVLGIFLYVGFYILMKGIIQRFSINSLEKGIAHVGILFNAASLVLYFWGLKSNGFSLHGDGIIRYGVSFDRDFPRLIGLMADPNYFIFYNTLFFAFYLCKRHTWQGKIGLLLCFITSILSFSRGGLLVLGAVFILYFIMNRPAVQLRLFTSIFAVLCMVWGICLAVGIDLLDMLGDRFGHLSSDGGSGRLELWERAWQFFVSNPLYGIGAGNFTDYNTFQYGDSLVVHNTFLEILTDSGILGFFAYAVFVFAVLLQLFQANIHRKHPYLFLAFIGYIFQMLFLSVIFKEIFFLFLAILSTYMAAEENRNAS